MTSGRTRRRFVQAASVAVVGAVAGCSRGDAGDLFGTTTSEDLAWPTFYGGPGNRSFAAGAAGPRSEPSVAVEATVAKEWTPMVSLLADGLSWNDQFRRVDLANGRVEEDVTVENAWPLALIEDGVLARVPVDDRAAVARYDETLAPEWRSPVDASSSPVLGDGALFAGARSDEDDVVRAVDLDDGDRRWEYSLDAELSGIAYDDGTVFVTGGSEGTAVLEAVDARDGEGRRLWRHDLAEADSFAPSVPVVADGTVYVARHYAIGGESPPPALFAVDAADGGVRWTGDGFSATMPVATAGVVYSAGRAYDPADGSTLWELDRQLRHSLEGPISSVQPVATNGRLFFAEVDPVDYTGFSLFSVSTTDGSLAWRREFDPGAWALRILDDRLVVGTAHGEVYVLR